MNKFVKFTFIFLSMLTLMSFMHPKNRPYPIKKAKAFCKPQQSTAVSSLKKTTSKVSPPYIAPKSKGLIVIDPGHGGKDLGAFSNKSLKYQEKTLALSVSKMVKTYLEGLGFEVSMTRTDDIFISLDDRSLFSNKLHPHLFVSIHFNSAPNEMADGIEIFYYKSKEGITRSNHSKQLAQDILTKIIENTNAKSRGVKHGNLSVIRETDVPAVLVEGGFLTNRQELERIKDASYLKRLAYGITQGIQTYLENPNNQL